MKVCCYFDAVIDEMLFSEVALFDFITVTYRFTYIVHTRHVINHCHIWRSISHSPFLNFTQTLSSRPYLDHFPKPKSILFPQNFMLKLESMNSYIVDKTCWTRAQVHQNRYRSIKFYKLDGLTVRQNFHTCSSFLNF